MKIKIFLAFVIIVIPVIYFKYTTRDSENLNGSVNNIVNQSVDSGDKYETKNSLAERRLEEEKMARKKAQETLDNSFSSYFSADFSDSFTLEEAGDMEDSTNDDFWVNSGAFLISENGVGRTLFDSLKKGDKWQVKYQNARVATAKETDGGYYPQNIFRLVTKSKWKNLEQEAFYNIRKYNLSNSFYRKASNAILLFNRYQDGYNLYYVGLRVDGNIIVKKKYKKKYYTMASEKVLDGVYNQENTPNLIPINKWIGIKSEVRTINTDQVEIKVFLKMDRNETDWKEVVTVVDDGKLFGGDAILEEGYAGIRTDFMDVEFDDYFVGEIRE